MAERDLMDQAVAEFLGESETAPPAGAEPIVEVQPITGAEPIIGEPAAPTPPPGGEQPTGTTPNELEIFNRLTGLNVESPEKIKEVVDSYLKLKPFENQMEVLPELVNALENAQNPLSYFKDEIAYKVSQITKEAKFAGKENIVDFVLRSDVETLSDVKVIELAAQLRAKEGVRNPLRAELRSMNIDPDEVIDGYDNLDEDTKDLLKIKADQYREELPKIGADIKVPGFEGTVVEQLLNQKKALKEDFEAKKIQVAPVAQGIITEFKELKIPGVEDFAFKLELTPDQIKSYSEELTELLASGQYDARTESGQQEIYGAIQDMFRADFFEVAFKAFSTFKTAQIEETFRQRYNNEKPLGGNEPPPQAGGVQGDIISRVAEQMVNERR